MDYEAILNKIQHDLEDHSVIDLYRYNGLMQAIDFFSNRLTFNQITEFAFEFVNELLTVSKSVMYLFDGSDYVIAAKKGITDELTRVSPSQKLQTFAILRGSVITDRAELLEFFEPAFLDFYQVKIMVPLTMEATLEGFILLSEKNGGPFVSDDTVICDCLMRIFTGALENNRRLIRLQQTNSELDEKIFNLFAINESSKILLAEHDLEVLHTLSVDVFSELTQSSRTGFFLLDEGAEKYTLKAYKDIYLSKISKKSLSLTLRQDQKIKPSKFLIDVTAPEDVEYFNRLFVEGVDSLDSLKPLYIVLLLKGSQILGFVTLGSTVSGSPFKSGIFELVESLASYTYIAISNAILLAKLNDHKRLLQEKLDRLMSLNRLMKNVNSADDHETLQELIMKTLEVSFGVEKGAFALYRPEDHSLTIRYATGIPVPQDPLHLNARWKKIERGSLVLETDEEEVYHYIGRKWDEAVGEKSGLLAVPIVVEKYDVNLLGALLIFKMREGLLSDEENLVVMETIANLSAPILQNFMKLEYERGALMVNHKETFLRELEKQIEECLALDVSLEVIHVETRFPLFAENPLARALKDELELTYPVEHNHIFAIALTDFQFHRYRAAEMAEMYGGKVTVYTLNKDFSGFDDFLELFQR